MLDLSESDPLDLVEGDLLSAPDVKLYRAERGAGGDSVVLRRVDDETPDSQAETAHPLSAYAPFFRDTEIFVAVLDRYRVGQVLCEPTFCDASYKFGGFVAPHRYLIISASARCLDPISLHPEWGLCVWPRGRHLKVIDIVADRGHVQITLLDVAEGYVAQCGAEELAEVERFFAAEAIRMFEAALVEAPLPELDTEIWRERLVLPIGIDDGGRPFPLPR